MSQPEQPTEIIPNTLGDSMSLVNEAMAIMNRLYKDALENIRNLMSDNDVLAEQVKDLKAKLSKYEKKE